VARNSSALPARLEIANSLEELVSLVKDEAKDLVSQRIAQFKNFPRHDVSNLFSELSFCVLTANWSAQGGMRAQELIGEGFLTMPPEDLEDALRSVGHRFAYQRARFILENRQRAHLLPLIVNGSLPSPEARSMLVKNFKGIGWKEASHFLRNVGLLDWQSSTSTSSGSCTTTSLSRICPKAGPGLAMKRMNNCLFPLCRSFTWI